ncbi:hypothetical protein CXF59_01785 [Flavobacterium sp. ALD4]|jgi:hypothetical protein|uniref:hypothetical protein n=1 Tax=Flavobacterium sp. ALD4 TaxID=2058314 RepID=UPI000C34BEEF|nr:hypothetical protein [Flavobacterium sp. ALD4]PKH69024.1 hypothetical protein CXF59_01785 [Flavobacterium sp. ALD4]
MKIGYKKRQMNINLILGLIWLVWFFIGILTKDKLNWTDYGWIVISVMYLSGYFYQRKNKYLTIENGFIKENSPFGKKINLTDIKQIKKFAGDYIIKTEKTELTINTQVIDSNSLAELKNELDKLNVAWS